MNNQHGNLLVSLGFFGGGDEKTFIFYPRLARLLNFSKEK